MNRYKSHQELLVRKARIENLERDVARLEKILSTTRREGRRIIDTMQCQLMLHGEEFDPAAIKYFPLEPGENNHVLPEIAWGHYPTVKEDGFLEWNDTEEVLPTWREALREFYLRFIESAEYKNYDAKWKKYKEMYDA